MPMTMMNTGESSIILRVGGGGEVRAHLADMGFVAGTEVSVVSEIAGNLIINIKGSRIALSKEMASRIYVG